MCMCIDPCFMIVFMMCFVFLYLQFLYSAQLSMFHMERCSRNTLIIIIILQPLICVPFQVFLTIVFARDFDRHISLDTSCDLFVLTGRKRKNVQYESVISHIFDGKILSSVQCLYCERVSESSSPFSSAFPAISRGFTILVEIFAFEGF